MTQCFHLESCQKKWAGEASSRVFFHAPIPNLVHSCSSGSRTGTQTHTGVHGRARFDRNSNPPHPIHSRTTQHDDGRPRARQADVERRRSRRSKVNGGRRDANLSTASRRKKLRNSQQVYTTGDCRVCGDVFPKENDQALKLIDARLFAECGFDFKFQNCIHQIRC